MIYYSILYCSGQLVRADMAFFLQLPRRKSIFGPFSALLAPLGVSVKFEKYPKVCMKGPDVAQSRSFGILDRFSTFFEVKSRKNSIFQHFPIHFYIEMGQNGLIVLRTPGTPQRWLIFCVQPSIGILLLW